MSVLRLAYRRARWALRQALGRDVRFPPQTRVSLEQHGSEYGGWTLCPRGLSAASIVYSVGVGHDITFDRSLVDTYGLTIHAFDPTPASVAFLEQQQLPPGFHWHPFGLAAYDGRATFYAPRDPTHVSHSMVAPPDAGRRAVEVEVRRVSTIMRDLGHARIDILKMDIEGAEYDVLEDMLRSNLEINQILVEFHHRLPGVGIERTRQAVRSLNAAGYRICFSSQTGEEVSFVRLA